MRPRRIITMSGGLGLAVVLTACGSHSNPAVQPATAPVASPAPVVAVATPATIPAKPTAACLATWQEHLNSVDTLDDSTITLVNDTPKTITVNGVDVSYTSGGYQVGSEQINPVDGTEGTGGIVLTPGSQAKVTMGADDIYLNGTWGSDCSIIDISWQNGDVPG